MSAEIIDFNKFVEDSKRINISHETLIEKEKDELQATVNKLNLMFSDLGKDES